MPVLKETGENLYVRVFPAPWRNKEPQPLKEGDEDGSGSRRVSRVAPPPEDRGNEDFTPATRPEPGPPSGTTRGLGKAPGRSGSGQNDWIDGNRVEVGQFVAESARVQAG